MVQHRIPVISAIEGMAAAVKQRLLSLHELSQASQLFREGKLEIVDICPPFVHAQQQHPWHLTQQEMEVMREARMALMDTHIGASLLLTPEKHRQSPLTESFFPNLEWVQSTFAGVEAYHRTLTTTNAVAPGFQLTRAGGIMPSAMAQYVFGWIVALERKFLNVPKYQAKRQYAKKELSYRPFRSLTIGILGLGDIGQGIGRLLKVAGFRVVGFKRRLTEEEQEQLSDCANQVTTQLEEVLAQADFIVSVLPSTSATHHLLHEGNLAVCQLKRPVFINVGRGDVIAEQTLLHALDNQIFSNAVLDVFETEPLPQESKLWGHPNVLLTPHVSAESFPEDVADIFVQNLDLFLQNQPLLYTVDWSIGY